MINKVSPTKTLSFGALSLSMLALSINANAVTYPQYEYDWKVDNAYTSYLATGANDPIDSITNDYRNIYQTITFSSTPNTDGRLRTRGRTAVYLTDITEDRHTILKANYLSAYTQDGEFNKELYDNLFDSYRAQLVTDYKDVRTEIEDDLDRIVFGRNLSQRASYASAYSKYEDAAKNAQNVILKNIYNRINTKNEYIRTKLVSNRTNFNSKATSALSKARYFSGCGYSCSLPSQSAIPSSSWLYSHSGASQKTFTNPHNDYDCTITDRYWEDKYSAEAYYCP